VENLLKMLKAWKIRIKGSTAVSRKVTSCSSHGAPRLPHDLEQAKSGKNYYELIDYIDADGHYYTKLEWTDLKTGDIQTFDWIDAKKEG
jgi:hypothetical protein